MHKDTSWLPFWEGFRVVELKLQAQEVHIRLEVDSTQALQCGRCRKGCEQVHEWLHRRVRDLPMLGYAVMLDVQLCRVV